MSSGTGVIAPGLRVLRRDTRAKDGATHNPATIEEVLKAGAGLPGARVCVKHALSGNGRATPGYAKDHAEGRG
ncbi:hypothetical protein [Streptomyces sp. NPDC001401]|uniref:hypothetical protein n=1 Tax=Streptomyces sp. NPDC001401 TaxID=3364570 RepID=UPI003695EFC4